MTSNGGGKKDITVAEPDPKRNRIKLIVVGVGPQKDPAKRRPAALERER